MISLKLVEKVDDFIRGPVLSTALVGGHTEDHRVLYNKALDLEPFIHTEPIKTLVSSSTATLSIDLDTTSAGGVGSFSALSDSFLLGSTTTHLKFDVGADTFVIYDAKSNTVFTDYIVDNTDVSVIYFNGDTIKDLTLLYRTEESIGIPNGFVKPTPTYTNFTLAYAEGVLTINLNQDAGENPLVFPDDTSVEISMNPLTSPEIKLVGDSYYKPWRLQAKQTAHLGKSMYISNITHESTNLRSEYVTNEKVSLLAHNIIQTEQKGLKLGGTPTYDAEDFTNGFVHVYTGSSGVTYPIDASVLDIDKDNGLILLDKSVRGHSTLRIDYSVDETSWLESNFINFNPMFSRLGTGLDNVENNYYNKVDLWYSKSTSGLYFSIENDEATKYNFLSPMDASDFDDISPSNASNTKAFTKVGTFILEPKDPSFLDIRKQGGKLINKSHSDDDGPIYDTRSHMSFGFMGVSPEQNNILVVGIGLNILKSLLNKYDTVATEDFYTTYGHTIDNCTHNADIIEYINNYIETRAQTEDLLEVNTLKAELQASIARYIPLGVAYLLTIEDTSDIIFGSTDESSFETKIAGEY